MKSIRKHLVLGDKVLMAILGDNNFLRRFKSTGIGFLFNHVISAFKLQTDRDGVLMTIQGDNNCLHTIS